MTRIRDEIMRCLWRGKDPYASPRHGTGKADLQGWGSQHRYLTEAIESRRPAVTVEVGVWKGASVIHMASRLRDLGIDGVVIAVDTWMGAWDHWISDAWWSSLGLLEPEGGIFATFLRNVKDAGLEGYIVPLPLDSINAAQVLRHLRIFPDAIHIDAGHDYAAVTSDLRQWWPLLNTNGIMIGDDYRAGNNWPGVKRAFDDFMRPLGLLPLENTDEKCRLTKPETDVRADRWRLKLRLTGGAVGEWREARRLEMMRLLEDEGLSAEQMLADYVRFDGPDWGGRIEIQDRIARAVGAGDRGDIFDTHGEVRLAAARSVFPEFAAHYPRPAGIEGFERFELLPAQANPFASDALPPPLNKNMGKREAPSLAVFRAAGCDLFLTPIGYQLFRERDDIFFPAASTRAYPREARQGPRTVVANNVVLVQDGFEGSNFSHTLFDYVPRVGHFLNAGLEDPSSCLFAMGGIASEFHVQIVRALCEAFELKEDQFVFPAEPEIWRIEGRVYFFSDFKDRSMHPANMANPRSVAIIRDVCSRIPTPIGDVKRIYISRGDTPLRRVENEVSLCRKLRTLGFVEVQLTDMPLLDQIELVRGAEVILAPHGMGLTHLVFHDGRPLIVELHNAGLGTDAYAFMAHALGFRYRAVLGRDLGAPEHHFVIPEDEAMNVLAQEGIYPPGATGSDTAARQRVRFLGGVQSVMATEVFDVPPSQPGTAALRHVRDDVAVQPDNNTGWLEVAELIEGAVYHCACDVWIPAAFRGERVLLDSALGGRRVWPADMDKRDRWQTIAVAGTARESVTNFVLRCDAEAGSVFYTCAWRRGEGIETAPA